MVQFPVISSNSQNLVFQSLDAKCLHTYKGIYCSSIPATSYLSFYSSGPQIQSKLLGVLAYSNVTRSLPHWDGRSRCTHVEFKEYGSAKRRFSLMSRPRKRFSKRMRKFSVRSALNDFGVFLRKNIKGVVLVTSVSAALSYLVLRLLAIPSPKVAAYSDLVTCLQSGSVSKVLFEEGSRRIYFNIKPESVEDSMREDEKLSSESAENENMVAETRGHGFKKSPSVMGLSLGLFRPSTKRSASAPAWQFSARKIDNDESFLLNLMREKGTAYSSAPQSVLLSFRSVLITVITLWVPLMPLMWLLYRQLNASNSLGNKRRPTNQGVGFDDVEGVDSAKMELMEIVLCLQGAINYKKLGARLPRGVLLVGPPGTGKTLLARAVAGEAGVPFFSVSASEFVELFVGRGAARIRDLFSVARKCAPSIVFIDELDAVGGKRGRSFNDERDQTLNQLLTEMDGFESDTRLIVIAATNRPEALDPALCRPGRFSRKVLVGEPDEEGRRKILAVHFREIPLEEDMQIICSLVASLTQGLVGADLANIVNEAALLAARRGSEAVSREDVMEAIERAKFGINGDMMKQQKQSQSVISKELGRLFPWMPSLMPRNDNASDGFMGYQTLS